MAQSSESPPGVAAACHWRGTCTHRSTRTDLRDGQTPDGILFGGQATKLASRLSHADVAVVTPYRSATIALSEACILASTLSLRV